MLLIEKIWCRAIQGVFRAVLPLLPYREPTAVPSFERLGVMLKEENVRSVLVVASRTVIKNRFTEPLEEALERAGVKYVFYDNTRPDPTVSNVEEAFEVYRGNACDAIIAIGGGSVMDCAKAVGAKAAYPRRSVVKMGGVMKIVKRIPTLVAVPTTAGTGSEATLAAVITDDTTHRKYAIMSFPLIPKYTLIDAALTCSVPPQLTATTGMDALTHAVEAYIGRATTKKTRALALEATELIFQNIELAYADGQNIAARENMLRAAYKAGVAFSVSYVGYIHAIAHSIGGRYGVPHGLANAVIMPYALEKYGKSAHKKLHRLGIAAGVCDESDTHSAGAEKFIRAIAELNAKMNIPDTLPVIEDADIHALARCAEREANPLYPVPKLMSAAELEEIYREISGRG